LGVRVSGAMLLLAVAIVGGCVGSSRQGVLKTGDQAPDFALQDQNGHQVKLSDYRGKKNVVLAFYIKAFTGGWTRELNAYQADIAKFDNAGTQVLGISVDGAAKNKAFAQSLGLTFPVLSDSQRTVSREYGVLIPVIRLAKRVTFIINKDGVILSIQRGGEAIDPNNAYASCSATNAKWSSWGTSGGPAAEVAACA
jgi:thioredoxin-dependent peroxiredoxin